MSEPAIRTKATPTARRATALLKDEQELVDKVKALAAKRRKLPPGGELKEDYVFQWANDGKVGKPREVLRAVRRQEHAAALLLHVRPELGQAVPVLHVAHGWLRSQLVPGHARRRVRRHRQGPGREDQCVGQATRMVADRAACPDSESAFQADYKCQGESDDMQWPVMHVFTKRGRQDLSFLGNGAAGQSRRYGVAVLEPHGLHAGGPAGPCHAAAEVQVGVPGEELSE